MAAKVRQAERCAGISARSLRSTDFFVPAAVRKWATGSSWHRSARCQRRRQEIRERAALGLQEGRHRRDHRAHGRACAYPLAPSEKARRPGLHRCAHAGGEDLCQVEGDAGVGVGAREMVCAGEMRLEGAVDPGAGRAGFNRGGIVGPVLQAHEADHRREEHLAGGKLEEARLGARSLSPLTIANTRSFTM